MPGRTAWPDRVLKRQPCRLPDGKIILILGNGGLPIPAGKQTHRGSPPRPVRGKGSTKTRHTGAMEASARQGRAGRRPGALAPRSAKGQHSAVAWAMAPSMAATQFRFPSGRDQETQRVSPAPAGRCPVDRQVQEQRRPAPDPAGEKRPLGAGRALAGGFGPRLGKGQRGAVAGAMAPARETRASRNA